MIADKDIEHLVVSVEKNGKQLPKQLRIKASAVIANQTKNLKKSADITETKKDSANIIVNTPLRGVGKNRNTALLFSSKNYCILTDDDMEYEENYLQTIKKAFLAIPKADVIIFNIKTKGAKDRRRKNNTIKRVRYYNFMNYGAARIVFKRESIQKNNIWFSIEFGGGAKYSSGEDTIFIKDCLDKRLKVYTYPAVIATVDQTSSTWFNGFSEKYYTDKGALLKALFPRAYFFAALYLSIKLKSKINARNRIKLILKGAKDYEANN